MQHLLRLIREDALGPSGRLPIETELAEKFGASRSVARSPVKLLEKHGVVESNKRRGTVLVSSPSPALVRQLAGTYARRVHVIAPLEKTYTFHWNVGTLMDLESALVEKHHTLEHVALPANPTPADLKTLLAGITETGSSALVILPGKSDTEFFRDNVDLLYQYHPSVVFFSRGHAPMHDWPFHLVAFDPFSEGALAAQHLHDLGYRRFIFWEGSLGKSYWLEERERGVRLGLARASDGALELEVWRRSEKPIEELCQHLAANAGDCAVIAGNDEQAADVLDAAREAGLCVPKDLALIGFDNNPDYEDRKLTTVAPPADEVGSTLADLIHRGDFHPGQDARLTIRLASRILSRATTPKRVASV